MSREVELQIMAAALSTNEARARHAYVVYVDDEYVDGAVALLKSLQLNNGGSAADFVVLYRELPAQAVARFRWLCPRTRFVHTELAAGDARTGILGALRLRGYDKVVALDADTVATGPTDELFSVQADFAAVPDVTGQNPFAPGLFVAGGTSLSERMADHAFAAASTVEGRPDVGGIGVAFGPNITLLPDHFNVARNSVKPMQPAPAARVLHFTGRFKPWRGGELGYALFEEQWRTYATSDLTHMARVLALAKVETVDARVLDHFRAILADVPDSLRVSLVEEDMTPRELLAEASALSSRGQYAAAVAVRRVVAAEVGRIEQPLALSADLRALSRYDEARAVGLLAVHERAPFHAYTWLAETCWITGEIEAAKTYVRAALQLNPVHVKARLLEARFAQSAPDVKVQATVTPGATTITHAAFYMDEYGNFGDELLPVAIRESIAAEMPVGEWRGVHVHTVFDAAAVEQANSTSAVVVGGGGLFLPDTMPNGNSGWQWNVPDQSLRDLRVPLALTAVGYNLFDGQEIHGRRFAESLRLTVETAALVGLRNHGSIDRVRESLPSSLSEKIVYMPCPTTFLGLLGNGPSARIGSPLPTPGEKPLVHLNIAYDRSGLRFKDEYGTFLHEIDRFVSEVSEFAEVRIAAHTVGDERIARDLYAECDTRVPVDSLFRLGVDGALDLYARSHVVVGMRGHAGMIPFGMGTPIISLVSHPKLRYFLEDIGHEEWGMSIFEESLGAKLAELTRDVVTNNSDYRAEVAMGREYLRGQYNAALQRLTASY